MDPETITTTLAVIEHLKDGKCPHWHMGTDRLNGNRVGLLCQWQKNHTGNHQDDQGKEW